MTELINIVRRLQTTRFGDNAAQRHRHRPDTVREACTAGSAGVAVNPADGTGSAIGGRHVMEEARA
ncbi:hypothetical protein [Micromonospora sonneratiae]|uniref:Uncharacterized protein n=1 Tax=Micromonospora sonneratiae TaxID=1184706 RepID=A0ABW3YNP7_9ACTN